MSEARRCELPGCATSLDAEAAGRPERRYCTPAHRRLARQRRRTASTLLRSGAEQAVEDSWVERAAALLAGVEARLRDPAAVGRQRIGLLRIRTGLKTGIEAVAGLRRARVGLDVAERRLAEVVAGGGAGLDTGGGAGIGELRSLRERQRDSRRRGLAALAADVADILRAPLPDPFATGSPEPAGAGYGRPESKRARLNRCGRAGRRLS